MYILKQKNQVLVTNANIKKIKKMILAHKLKDIGQAEIIYEKTKRKRMKKPVKPVPVIKGGKKIYYL